jgi:beta-lactamase class A
MKIISLTFILTFIFSVSACSQNKGALNTNSPANQANSQQTKQKPKQNTELQKRIEQAASAAKGRVGAGVMLLETGEAVYLNQNEQFPMQSVYKLPIAMAAMRQVDNGNLKLEQKIRVEKEDFVRKGMASPLRDKNPNGAEVSVAELVRLSVSESDGTASDVLFRLAGGAEAIQKFLEEIEVKEIAVVNTEKEIGRDWETQYRNWASPEGAIALLRALQERRGLSETSQAYLLKVLTEATTGPKRLKGLLPKGTPVAHKTGTGGTRNGITGATNDIGIITLPNGKHLAVAVFVSDSPADEATRERVIAEIAKIAWDEWSK